MFFDQLTQYSQQIIKANILVYVFFISLFLTYNYLAKRKLFGKKPNNPSAKTTGPKEKAKLFILENRPKITVICGILIFIILFLINLRYFQYRDPIFSADDPAIHLTAIKSIINHTPLTYYFLPSAHYQLPVFWSYFIIAWLSKFLAVNFIVCTKIFTIAIFSLTPVLAFFITRRYLELTTAVIIAFFINFDHLFQSLFWGGNINQIIGLVFILAIILIFQQIESISDKNKRNVKLLWLLLALILATLSLGFHTLTFLILLVVGSVYTIYSIVTSKLNIYYKCLLFLAIIIFFPLPFLKSPDNFSLYIAGFDLKSSFLGGLNLWNFDYIIAICFIIGLFISVKKWHSAIIPVVAIVSLVFSTAGNNHPGFYPERFPVYLSIFIIIFLLAAYEYANKLISKKWLFLLVSSIFLFINGMLVLIPTSLVLRVIYHSEYALPARVPSEDVSAMEWIQGNTNSNAIIGGPFKWGEYIPILADRRVVYYPDQVINYSDPGFKVDIKSLMAGDSPQQSYLAAQRLGVNYVLWSYQLNKSKNPYFVNTKYKNNFFDQQYFTKVYDENDVQIYKVN